ncbi:tetratricopeptide repeat protein [Microcoleus sp. T3B2]|uniref:tetratricopeptide repeat protein n=1 Tax=Microcoleus sp. T3B2 TaxID=3055426 RepID=UPI002FD1A2EF
MPSTVSTESTAVQFNQQGEIYLSQGKIEEAIASCEQALKIHPNFAPAYKTLGNALQAQGRMEEARHWYAKAIEIEPNFAEVYANLGSICAQQQKWQEAIGFYQKAIAIKPNFAGVYRNLAKVFGQINKPEEAQQCWYQAFSLEPEKVAPGEHLNMGDAFFRQEKFPEAIACYDRAIKLNPNVATAYQNLGEALKKQGKLEEATVYYRKAIELNAAHARNGSEGQETLAGANGTNGAVKQQPSVTAVKPPVQQAVQQAVKPPVQQAVNSTINIEDPEAYKILAEGYFAQGKLEQAIAACKKALQIKPEAPLYKMLGNALQAGGKIDEAKSCYVKAIEINPNFAEAYANYGSICAQQEQWQQAVSAYEKAIALKPDFAGAFRNYAKLLSQLGKSEEAAEAWYRAFAIDPKSGTAEEHENLAKTLIEQGKVDKGIECYRRAVELNPNAGAAYHELGEILKGQEQWEAAVDAYTNAIRNNPDLSWSHNNLAESLVKLERWEDSVNAYRKAIELNPDFSWSHNNLADVLLKLERWEEAVESYRKATELNPDFSWSHNYLADALIKLGRWDEAISAYQRSIELNPDHFWAHNNLAEALVNLERWDEAVVAYRRANEVNPNFFWSQSKLGDALLELERWDEAIDVYRRAAELNPDFPWTYYNMGTAFENLERWDESIAAYRRAAEIQADLPWLSQKLADALRMRSQWDLRDAMGLYRRAIQDNRDDVQLYHKALEIAPNDADLYVELANALGRKGWADGAIVFYQMALQIRPDDKAISGLLEEVLEKKKGVSNAIASPPANSPIESLLLDSYTSIYERAEFSVKFGQWREAIICYIRAFQLHPDLQHTDWVQRNLGSALKDGSNLQRLLNLKSAPSYLKLTVIVPIFNAYEYTKRCLDSLFKHTSSQYNVLLIDDASPDTRVRELTQQIAARYSHVRLIRNQENLGFVKSCNLAFQATAGEDVVLLNSDTVVTNNWLNKMIAAAYSDAKVATVTPLTNNGTICSVPVWLEENEIPADHTIESFAELIDNISYKCYPTIPTGVGFCMYIKREVLDQVGYFDDVHFGKGYGEENDLCCRATVAGYIHIIDDATFVYHAGGKSFGPEKQNIINNNLQQLAQLHPTYLGNVAAFIANKPVQDIISNIQLHLRLSELKRLSPICFILHNDTELPLNHNLGGTEYHCSELVAIIKQNRPVYTFYGTARSTVMFNIFFQDEEFRFEFPCQSLSSRPFLAEQSLSELFIALMNYFEPQIIHIHHLINLPIVDIAFGLKNLKIPYIISTHDYYFICPSHNLLDLHKSFCFEYKSESYCQKCIHSLFTEGENIKQEWYSLCLELMLGASVIISPSDTAKSYMIREYPQLSNKIQVIRHGVQPQSQLDKLKISQENGHPSPRHSPPIRVAFVGTMHLIKGLNVVIKLLQKVWANPQIKELFSFEFYGPIDNSQIDDYLMSLIRQNTKIYDAYSRQDLPKLLKNVDVVMLPVIWAETYSLVLDEVLSLGIPVITTPLGANAERVKKYGVGWVSNSCSAEDLLEILIFLAQNPVELNNIKSSLDNYPLVSYESMTQEYQKEYKKIMAVPVEDYQGTNNDQGRFKGSIFVSYLKAKWIVSNFILSRGG